MSRILKGLSTFINGNNGRAHPRDPRASEAGSDAGPSTLTTPLFPVDGADSDGPSAPSGVGAGTPPAGALVPLPAATTQRSSRKATPSRALNAVVRATTQVALPTQVEPVAPPKVVRAVRRSTVVLTETEKLRLQIMQVQLKLTGLSLYEGPIDGMMNHDLAEGVRHFQTLKGMRDTGMLTTGTLTALGIHAID
jgi:hypothetical protein